MRPKTIIILVVILAVLLILAVVAFQKTRPPAATEETNKPYFPDFDEKNIGAVLLEKPKAGTKETERVELKISEMGWVVANRWNYPADARQVENLMKVLGDLRRGEVRSNQPGQHKLFEVSADKALRLKVDDLGTRTLAEIYVGKSSRGGKYFSRDAGSDDVRTVDFRHFSLDPASWLSRRCFQPEVVKADKVSEISVTRSAGTFRLLKTEIDEPDPANASQTVKKTVWEVVEPEKFRSKEGVARSLASTITGLHIDDIADNTVKPEHGFDNASLFLTAVVEGYGNITITFGALRTVKKNGREVKSYYAKISGINEVVLISESRYRAFDKKLGDFREPKKEDTDEPGPSEDEPGPPKLPEPPPERLQKDEETPGPSEPGGEEPADPGKDGAPEEPERKTGGSPSPGPPPVPEKP